MHDTTVDRTALLDPHGAAWNEAEPDARAVTLGGLHADGAEATTPGRWVRGRGAIVEVRP